MSELLPFDSSQANRLTEPARPRIVATPDAHAAAGEMGDLKEILAVMRRRRWLVIAAAALGATVAGYFAYVAKPVFLASASVRIADARRALSGGIGDAPRDVLGSGNGVDPVLSQVQVLKSREVAANAVRRQPLGLTVYPDGFPASDMRDVRAADSSTSGSAYAVEFDAQGYTLRSNLHEIRARYGEPVSTGGVSFAIVSRPPHRSGTIGVLNSASAVGMLLSGVDARPRKSTDVVDVTYRANDPFVAQQVANAIVAAYKEVNASIAQQQSRRRREFIQEQLKQTDSSFADATVSLSNFRSHEQVYGSDARVAAEATGLMTLDVTREELASDKRTLQSLLDNLQRTGGATHSEKLDALLASPSITSNQVVEALFAQLVQLRTRRDTLTVGNWGAARSNPDVIKLDTLIQTTQGELVSAVRSNIDAVNARLSSLDDLRGRNAAQLQKLPSVQAVEARLLQRVETARKMADQLREEYQRARISEAVEVGQVEIVDLANEPDAPIGRGTLFRVLSGLLLGLLFGGGGAVLLDRLNSTIRRRDEIETTLHIPGLSIIPHMAPARKLTAFGRHLRLPGSKQRRDRSGGDSLVTVSDFGSVSAEAFRTLRTNLLFSQSIQTLRTIVITSPSPQDGKTTTAANLAVTFAQQGMRVLLIDCDLRKARMHNIFSVPREPGFSQLLAHQSTVADVVRETAVENLFVIPAGLLPANPSELLGSVVARETIESLAKEYAIVIIDTPPVHVAADALILGSMANGVLMVLRAGRSERDAAKEALQRLLNVGAHVIGAVLNDPDHKVPDYGSYYYYYDYHDTKVEA
ncbi:MAG: polysaccharide biosynthesis tyrosine autokinase [Chthoniobacterales bacterium]|nr:polysaccharide biosynthesis tyrosine autokinase [Chthoniobacterales bacterium]